MIFMMNAETKRKAREKFSNSTVWKSIINGLKEVELVENGKLKSRSAIAFLNEI